MRTEKLDYKLPKELIAQEPVFPRDSAKMMVLDRKNRGIEHSRFDKIDHFFEKGDVLVFNQSKVFPARIFGKSPNGKKIEVVFLEEIREKEWEVLIGGKINTKEVIDFGIDFNGELDKKETNILKVNKNKKRVFEYLEKYGKMPLPPYIKRESNEEDKENYQNVFSEELGSAAAPTAGLHFTKGLIKGLKEKGVQIEYVTLHVGLGTFAPVRTEKLEAHDIHSEHFEVNEATSKRINKAKDDGRRIIACGTTSVRVLETCVENGYIKPQKGSTKLFIYPGYEYQIVDGIITNFHIPKSSLLALVYAFYGEEETRKAYKEAIEKRYRFFSYGDGMLIL